MAEPGWYNAAGDPPGTQRYWDGNAWLGEPVFEPTQAPAMPAMPAMPPASPAGGYAYAGGPVAARSRFPGGLKAVAIIVSLLKAIPLLFGLLGAVLLASVSRGFDDSYDDLGYGLDNVFGAAVAFILVILLIGFLLVGFQFVGALKERPMMVFIPAMIMTLLDVPLTLGAWVAWNESRNSAFQNDSAAGPVMMTAIAGAQIYIAVQAIRANKN